MNKNSTAYIDASNLKFGIQQSNWELDYKALLLKRTNVPIVILDDFIKKLKAKTKKPPDMP